MRREGKAWVYILLLHHLSSPECEAAWYRSCDMVLPTVGDIIRMLKAEPCRGEAFQDMKLEGGLEHHLNMRSAVPLIIWYENYRLLYHGHSRQRRAAQEYSWRIWRLKRGLISRICLLFISKNRKMMRVFFGVGTKQGCLKNIGQGISVGSMDGWIDGQIDR